MKKIAEVMIVVVMLFAVVMSCSKGGGTNPTPATPSLFPTTDDVVTKGTATTTVIMSDNIQLQAVSGQVIAEFKDTATRNDYDNLVSFLTQKGFSIIGQIPNLYMVQIGVTLDTQIVPLISDLKSLPYIEDTYPNMVVSGLKDPNPSVFTGSDWINDIQARDAWNISTGKSEVIIGIIDSGVNPNNVQFKKNNIKNLNDFNVGDGHGLAVASVAVANGNDADVNPYGTTANNMAGVCWNCSVATYDSIVFNTRSVLFLNLGIKKAINTGAKVVNISQGFSSPIVPFTIGQKKFRTKLKKSIKFAHDKDVLLIFAAGNEPAVDDHLFNSSLPEYEAYWKSNAIVVGGSYQLPFVDYIYKNYVTGAVVDIAAPALGISVAAADGSVITDNGTSFSAPMVSGAAGLIWSVNPTLSPADVKAILTDPNNTTLATNSVIRILNLYKALSDPRVAVNINGIALGILVNSSTGKVVINNMIFDKANLTLHIMGDDGYYSYGSQSPYQISGNALDTHFYFFNTSSGNWFPAEMNGTIKSSSLATGDWLMNSSIVGNFEIDFIGVAMTSPSCLNFTHPLTLLNYGGSNLSITIAQKYSSSMLNVSSGNANIHTGNGWISGNQVFVNFIDTADSANMKTTLLQGTMSADCLSALGTWSSHAFGSVAEIATGTWQLTR